MKPEPRTSFGYMPFYFGDYDADTGHLSTLEHGVYFLLIKAYWKSSKALPDNDPKLANLARLPLDEWRMMRSTISEFFLIQDGFWFHKRIDRELAHFRDKSEKAKKAREIGINRSREARQRSDDESLFATDVQRTLDERSTIGVRSTDVTAQTHPEFDNYNGISKSDNGRSTDVKRPINYSDSDTDKTSITSVTEYPDCREILEKHTPEVLASGTVQFRYSYLRDDTFKKFVALACQFWDDVVEEDLQKSFDVQWRYFDFQKKLDVVRRLQERITAGEESRYVTRPPKYLESGNWRRPPRIPKNGHIPAQGDQKSKYQPIEIPLPPED